MRGRPFFLCLDSGQYDSGMRLRLWLVMVPLLAAGAEGAASILDRFAPPSYENAELFARGNASHVLLPVVAALGVAILLYAVCHVATSAPARRRNPGWAFACLPFLIFALQEHVEYVVGHGHVPWLLAANPVFLAGLVLQAPFAIAAYMLARTLLGVAVAIAERRRAVRVAWRRRPPLCPAGTDAPLRLRFVGCPRLTRGPPHAIAV
jgi:hypothetical protein